MKLNDRKIGISNRELEDIIIKSVNDNIISSGVEKWLRKALKHQEKNL